jgi:hypothetical protein
MECNYNGDGLYRSSDDTMPVDYERIAHRAAVAALDAEDAEDAAHEKHDPRVDADRFDCDLCRDYVARVAWMVRGRQ